MKSHIVEISKNGYYLSLFKGFIQISDENDIVSKVPIDTIDALLITAYGVTYTNPLLSRLAEECIPLIICSNNFVPSGILIGINNNYKLTEKLFLQTAIKKTFLKKIWQSIIRSKIKNQESVLKNIGLKETSFESFINNVHSGDPHNVEAQASRVYWQKLFSKDFRRNVLEVGVNSYLNYGYAVVRACIVRIIISSGLNPSLGIFHKNLMNAFCLADDLIEPFRPVVDEKVFTMTEFKNKEELILNYEDKKELVGILEDNVLINKSRTTVRTAIEELVYSLIDSYKEEKDLLKLPSLK